MRAFVARVDSWAQARRLAGRGDPDRIDWVRCAPFLALHLACFAVLLVGLSPVAVGVAALLYVVRMFGLTAGYHRYFSHRTYRTSRPFQLCLAVLGASAVQRGPLWWAAHHRNHHRTSDEPEDVHSPVAHGFLRSHIGWFMTRRCMPTDVAQVRDLARYPELRFLDRFDTLVPMLLAASLYGLGAFLAAVAPGLGTNGWQMLVWGFCISTVVLVHATGTINSLAHRIGSQPYETGDSSRNHLGLALLTLGEGWHNNHHRYPGSVRQGFRPWQIDLSWYGLLGLRALGLVWDLRPVPAEVVEEARVAAR